VLIYGAYRLSGYSSLMLWLCFFTASLLIAGYTHCSLYSGNSKTALLGSSDDLVVRDRRLCNSTQMIGYLLLVVELLMFSQRPEPGFRILIRRFVKRRTFKLIC